MVKHLLCVWLLLLSVLTSCAGTNRPKPGELGIQFSGVWGAQPDTTIQPEPYPFLVRLTGYVPPEAYMVVVTNQYGNLVASAPIRYQDAMQINPIRHYQFNQKMTREVCRDLQELELRRGAQELERKEFTITDWTREFTMQVILTASVITQTKEPLVSVVYTVRVHCMGPGA